MLRSGGRRAEALVSRQFTRFLSTASSELVNVKTDSRDGVATLTLQRPPVNSLSLEMCQAISQSIHEVEADDNMRALILASSNPKIFSAGLDLKEMHRPETSRISAFWSSFQQLYLDLYGSRLATVACLQGTAPAAGCMLALSCDYRILSSNPKAKIGLNETKLGIVAPPWLARQFVDTVGHRQAELGLALGTLYTPQQALEIGLVDEIVEENNANPTTIQERALEQALTFAKIPPHALQACKAQLRGHALKNMEQERRQDLESFVTFIMQDQVQKTLSSYLEALAKPNAK